MSVRDWPTTYPRLIVALCVLATLLSLAFCFRLRPETSIEGLLDPTDPAVHALGRVLDRFPVVGELLVLVSLPEDAPADDARLLAFAERLSTSARETSTIASVTFRPPDDFRRFVSERVVPNAIYYLDDEAYASALQRLTRQGMDEQLARTRQAMTLPGPAAGGLGKTLAKHDPLNLFSLVAPQLSRMLPGGASPDLANADSSKGGFFSQDHRKLLVRIAGKRPPSDLSFCKQITRDAHALIDAANTDGLTIDVGGAYAVATYSADAIRHDAILGVNGSIVGIGLLFLALYRRSLRMFLFAFTPMAVGIAFGFGVFAVLKPTLTPLAAVVGGALGGIGIDYLVFYLVHHEHDRATIPDRRAAIRATSARLRGSLRTAWLTSVVGFLSVAWSPIHVLRDFALLGTLALGGAYLATVLLLPASLAAFDPQRRPLAAARAIGFVRPVGWFIARRPIGVLAASGVVGLGAIAYLLIVGRSLAPSTDLLLLHPRPNPPMQTQRKITDAMGISPGSLQLYLQSDSPQNLLRLAHNVERRLQSPALREAEFDRALSLASMLPDPDRGAQRQAAIDPRWPDQVRQAFPAALNAAGFNVANYSGYAAFLQRLVAPDAPPSIDALRAYPSVAQLVLARDAIAPDAAAPRESLAMVFFRNPLERRDQRDRAVDALTAALAGVEADGHGTVTITGMPVVNRNLEAAIHRDLPKLTLAAVVWIALCHAVHFRSIGLALLSMVPTAISALAVLVYMTWQHEPLNLVNMVMVPLLIGIDTDYGILTVAAYQDARGSRRRLLRAFPSAVSAVITCAGTTIIGFGSLVLVSIPAVQSLGWLINVGIVSCLIGTIVGVWPMMFWMAGRGSAMTKLQ